MIFKIGSQNDPLLSITVIWTLLFQKRRQSQQIIRHGLKRTLISSYAYSGLQRHMQSLTLLKNHRKCKRFCDDSEQIGSAIAYGVLFEHLFISRRAYTEITPYGMESWHWNVRCTQLSVRAYRIKGKIRKYTVHFSLRLLHLYSVAQSLAVFGSALMTVLGSVLVTVHSSLYSL